MRGNFNNPPELLMRMAIQIDEALSRHTGGTSFSWEFFATPRQAGRWPETMQGIILHKTWCYPTNLALPI